GGLHNLSVEIQAKKPPFSSNAVIPDGELFIQLEGILNPVAEIERLHKEIERAKGFIAILEKKLSNEAFVQKAPQAVLDAEHRKLATQKDIIEKSKKALAELE
ncbi:MAG: valine--tRNA ligase, partial [Fibrobacter sp.]|nr:valine--tRNA ligase [Fibrobacter sp.]